MSHWLRSQGYLVELSHISAFENYFDPLGSSGHFGEASVLTGRGRYSHIVEYRLEVELGHEGAKTWNRHSYSC